jgi:hypothetical protein
VSTSVSFTRCLDCPAVIHTSPGRRVRCVPCAAAHQRAARRQRRVAYRERHAGERRCHDCAQVLSDAHPYSRCAGCAERRRGSESRHIGPRLAERVRRRSPGAAWVRTLSPEREQSRRVGARRGARSHRRSECPGEGATPPGWVLAEGLTGPIAVTRREAQRRGLVVLTAADIAAWMRECEP